MVLAVATYSLTLVMASFPFLLTVGQAFFIQTQGKLTAAFMSGLGEWYFIGITMSIASVLIAVDAVFDQSLRIGSIIKAFAVWSAISGIICLGCFTVFTIVKTHIATGSEMATGTAYFSILTVMVTISLNAVTYIKIRIANSLRGQPLDALLK